MRLLYSVQQIAVSSVLDGETKINTRPLCLTFTNGKSLGGRISYIISADTSEPQCVFPFSLKFQAAECGEILLYLIFTTSSQ